MTQPWVYNLANLRALLWFTNQEFGKEWGEDYEKEQKHAAIQKGKYGNNQVCKFFPWGLSQYTQPYLSLKILSAYVEGTRNCIVAEVVHIVYI